MMRNRRMLRRLVAPAAGAGAMIRAAVITTAEPTSSDLDVSDVLRLQTKVAVVAGTAGECRGYAYPAWGQPYLTSG